MLGPLVRYLRFMGCDVMAATELGQGGAGGSALSPGVETPGGAAFFDAIIEALPSLAGFALVLLASMVGISYGLLVTGV